MFGKTNPKQKEIQTTEETVAERELKRLLEERSSCDPKGNDYKKYSEAIALLQDEVIKNKTIEGKTIENLNKSNEGNEKKAERKTKVAVAVIKGTFALGGCLAIPIMEQVCPPMSKMFPFSIGNLFKQD